MKKINPYNSIFFGLSISFVMTYFLQTQSDIDIIRSIIYPVGKILEIISHLSLNSYFGNLTAWLLLLLFFSAPLIVIRYLSKDIYKKVNIKYIIIIVLMIISTVMYLKGSEINVNLDNAFLQLLQLPSIAFSYYFLWIGLFYELFVNIDLSDNKNKNATLYMLSFVSFILAIFIGSKVSTTFINYHNIGLWGFIDIIVSIFINVFIFKAIFKIYKLLSQEKLDWFSDETLIILSDVKIIFNKVIEIAIYLTIFVTMLKLFALPRSGGIDFNFNIPVLELVVSVTLSLFLSVIAQSILIKKENDQFV